MDKQEQIKEKREPEHFIVEMRCLNCHQSYWDIYDKPCKPFALDYERPIYDCVSGRALPGHPGLA